MAKLNLRNIGPLLREKRGGSGIREVASEIGISPATLSRVENGRLPNIEAFSKICNWLQVDAEEIFGSYGRKADTKDTEKRNIVSVHLKSDRTQTPEVAAALTDMILKAQDMINK